MKRFKNTLAFAFCVFILLVYVTYEYKNSKNEYKKKVEAKNVFPGVKPESLKEFKFISSGQTIFLAKRRKVWQLESPVQYPADQEFLEDLLRQLLSDSLQLVSSHELTNEKVKEYGLDKPLLQIGFKQDSGKFQDVLISSQNTYDGKTYLKKISGDEVFIADSFWQNLSEKSVYDFRWKNMYIHLEPVDNIIFKKDFNKKIEFTYNKKLKKWQAGNDKKNEVSREDMGLLVSDLTEIKIFRFLSEKKDDENLRKYGLYQPQFELEFYFRKANIKKWSLKISKEDRGKFYATLEGRPQIFQLNKPELNKLKVHFNRLQ